MNYVPTDADGDYCACGCGTFLLAGDPERVEVDDEVYLAEHEPDWEDDNA